MLLRISLLLMTLLACLHLQQSEVAAKSARQSSESRQSRAVACSQLTPVTATAKTYLVESRVAEKKDIRESVFKELRKKASVGDEHRRSSGHDWKQLAKKWNADDDDDEEEPIEAKREFDDGEGPEYKRRFDSLGGGLIPIKRRRYDDDAKRMFDSLGGGLIPAHKRRSYSPFVEARRRAFDSLGGGYLPIKRRRYV